MKIAKIAIVAGALALAGGTANATTLGWGTWGGGASWSYSIKSNGFASQLFKGNDYSAYSSQRGAKGVLRKIKKRLKKKPVKPVPPTLSDVPVPASGLLLVGALGVIALRRRKS